MQLYMVELTVTDVALSEAWYERALGLRTTLVDLERGFRLLEASGGGRVALKQGQAQSGGVALQFEVSELLHEIERLTAMNIPIHQPVKISPEGYRRITLLDPDGHLIGLFDWHQPDGNPAA